MSLSTTQKRRCKRWIRGGAEPGQAGGHGSKVLILAHFLPLWGLKIQNFAPHSILQPSLLDLAPTLKQLTPPLLMTPQQGDSLARIGGADPSACYDCVTFTAIERNRADGLDGLVVAGAAEFHFPADKKTLSVCRADHLGPHSQLPVRSA